MAVLVLRNVGEGAVVPVAAVAVKTKIKMIYRSKVKQDAYKNSMHPVLVLKNLSS